LTETVTASGCSKTNSVVITVNPTPNANTGPNASVCLGSSTVIGTPAVVGDTYSWTSNPVGFTSTLANPTVNPIVTTIYTLTETVTATSCTKSNSVTITVNPLPTANAGSNGAVCNGSSTIIGAPGVAGNTYSWTSNPVGFTSTVANPTVSPIVTTTYTLTETTTATGCNNSNMVTITVTPSPNAFVGPNDTLCVGMSVTLGGASVVGDTYSWVSNPVGFTSMISNPSVNPTVNTIYTLTETNTATGCTRSNSVTVVVKPLPTAGFTSSLTGLTTYDFTDVSINAMTYAWNFGDGQTSTLQNPSNTYAMTGIYTVTLTASNSCGTDAVIEVLRTNIDFYNGFSPNGDGYNDFWNIPVLNFYTSNTVTIINRWGSEVWRASSYDNETTIWTGKNMNGEDLPDGTYYYIITYNNTEKRGWVFIKR
jgi:gliding motility-associated-like protein